MGIFGDGNSRDDYLQLEARVASLEAAVSELRATVATLGSAPVAPAMNAAPVMPPRWEIEARALKQAGKTIDAIKLVREQTAWDLRSAKDYVDRL